MNLTDRIMEVFNMRLTLNSEHRQEKLREEIEKVLPKWLPIESAPRNTWCLIWQGGACIPAIGELRLADDNDGIWTGQWIWSDYKGSYWDKPTHWMPLPAPPSNDSKGE